ncbi:hypothetical protein J5X84_07645 [Streptosporangiaceae bacterium NEAU-GS5]|nr:hypothetical protein [Streptosporangiaceae bacterium NEAU-GS5]
MSRVAGPYNGNDIEVDRPYADGGPRPMDEIVSAVTGWGYVAVAVVIIIVLIGQYVHRRRTGQILNWTLLEQVDGLLGADDRRLADTARLLQRSRQAGLTTRLHVSGIPREIPADVDVAAYRIVEEAITSVLEHGMSAASVEISYDATGVTLTVDSPVGSRPVRYSGLGRMRERAGAIGGTVEAGPHRGGWRVIVHLPIDVQPA